MFGMTQEEKQMLSDIHNDQGWLIKEMKAMRAEAISEDGYKRCVRHKAAVDTLAGEVTGMKKSYKWVRNTAVGGFISMLTVGCAAAANYVLGN